MVSFSQRVPPVGDVLSAIKEDIGMGATGEAEKNAGTGPHNDMKAQELASQDASRSSMLVRTTTTDRGY